MQPKKKQSLSRRAERLQQKQQQQQQQNRNNSHSRSSSSSTQSSQKKLKPTERGYQQQLQPNEDDLSSNCSSSSFSSSSRPQSSVDYEAEDENEDKQRRPSHKNENDSLLHVQNFLKCFGPNAYATTATLAVNVNPPQPMAVVPSKPLPTAAKSSSGGELRAWRHNFRSTIPSIRTTTAVTATAPATSIAIAPAPLIATTLPLIQAQASGNHKPQKFQINTKFLRKPRNKLMKMLPTAANTLLEGQGDPEPEQEQEPQQNHQVQPPLLFNEDSNAKFKDFSIDSLLNK